MASADDELEEMEKINRLERERIGREKLDSWPPSAGEAYAQMGAEKGAVVAIRAIRANSGASLLDAKNYYDKALRQYRSAQNKNLEVPSSEDAHGLPPIEWYEEQIRLRFERMPSLTKGGRRMLEAEFQGFRRPGEGE